jgi:hypothetical protein
MDGLEAVTKIIFHEFPGGKLISSRPVLHIDTKNGILYVLTSDNNRVVINSTAFDGKCRVNGTDLVYYRQPHKP